MLEAFLKIIDYIGGSGFAILAIILIFVLWAMYKIGSFKEKISGIDKTNSNIDEIRKNLAEMSGNINYIMNRLELGPGPNNQFAQRHSPVRLTEKGESLLERTIKPFIDNSFDDILDEFEDIKNLSNPFDIEQFSKKIALSVYEKYTSDNDKDKIKNILFLDGATMNDFLLITRIYLRDKFFDYKGIDIKKMEEEEKQFLKNNRLK